jgi:hypothetical protein
MIGQKMHRDRGYGQDYFGRYEDILSSPGSNYITTPLSFENDK